jgi:hypothetical protein
MHFHSKSHTRRSRSRHTKLKTEKLNATDDVAALNDAALCARIAGSTLSVEGGRDAIRFAHAISNLPPQDGSKPTATQLNNLEIARRTNILKP